jgi:hypothetical protein
MLSSLSVVVPCLGTRTEMMTASYVDPKSEDRCVRCLCFVCVVRVIVSLLRIFNFQISNAKVKHG